MLFAQIEAFPDLGAAALDEVLAVWGCGVDHELGDLLGPIIATVVFDEPIDSRFELTQLHSYSVFRR